MTEAMTGNAAHFTNEEVIRIKLHDGSSANRSKAVAALMEELRASDILSVSGHGRVSVLVKKDITIWRVDWHLAWLGDSEADANVKLINWVAVLEEASAPDVPLIRGTASQARRDAKEKLRSRIRKLTASGEPLYERASLVNDD